MSSSERADEAVLQHALQRGYLRPEQARELLAAAAGRGVLAQLARYLLPEQLEELRTIYRGMVPPAPPQRAQEAGSRIGDYEIERELARGGMGVVYVARHVTMGRRVAIKRMLAHRANFRGERRFQTEARLVATLQHPGIVKVHELGLEGVDPFIVMDLIEGESLAKRIAAGGPLDSVTAATIARDLAGALQHAHEHDVLHRDLKPANVLLDAAGRALLTDFGLAKDLSEERERLTRTGQTIGTPAYMSPEQARGETGNFDARTDVYGLGATLYAMLTGRPPFVAGSPMAQLAMVCAGTPEAPSQHRRGIDRSLEAVCMRCLARRPEDRYASARELGEDLQRFLGGEAVEAPLRSRTGPWPVIGVIALLLAAVSVGLGVWHSSDASPPAVGAPGPSRALALEPSATATLASASEVSARPTPRPLKGAPLWTMRVSGLVGGALFADGRVLAISWRKQRTRIAAYDVRSDKRLAHWSLKEEFRAVDVRGTEFALGTATGKVWFGDLAKPEAKLKGGLGLEGGGVRDLVFAPKGARVLVARYRVPAHTLTIPDAKAKVRFKGSEESSLVAYSPSRKRVALCSEGDRGNWVALWSLGKKKRKRLSYHPLPTQAASLAFSPSGEVFAVGDENGGVLIFDGRGGKLQQDFQGVGLGKGEAGEWLATKQRIAHRGKVAGISFSADGKRLSSLGFGRNEHPTDLATWDVATGKELERVALEPKGYDRLAGNATHLLLVAKDSETLELRPRFSP